MALLLLATLGTILALLAVEPHDVFWATDNGNRFLQMTAFLRTGGLALDDAPPIGHHLVRWNGHVVSFYSPAFAIASAPFYAWLGTWGLFVLPAAGTLAVVLLLAVRAERDSLAVAALTLAATPILWYGLVFWECAPAAALALGAFLLARRGQPLWAGLVAAASVPFREEGYVVLASLGVALVLTRKSLGPPLRLALGALPVLLPWWAFNMHAFGSPFGLHAAIYETMGRRGLSNVFTYLLEGSSRRPWCYVLVAPSLAVAATAWLGPTRARVAAFAGAACGLAALGALQWTTGLRETLSTQGLLPAIPLLLALFLAPRDRFLLVTLAAGTSLTCALLNQADIGIIWGPRHFLWMAPLIVIGAAASLREALPRLAGTWRWVAAGAASLLVLASVLLQAHGLVLLHRKLHHDERLLAAVRACPGSVVVTDAFWAPEGLASLAGQWRFIWVDGDAALTQALAAMNGPFVFLDSHEFRQVSPSALLTLRPRIRRVVKVQDSRDDLLQATVLACDDAPP